MNEIVRNSDQIKGLKIKGEEYKLQALGDDLVFILEDPDELIDALMNVWQEYGEVAGLKVNWDKSQIVCKNVQTKKIQELLEKTQFKQDK